MASDHAKWRIIRDDYGDIVVGVDMTDRSRSRFPSAENLMWAIIMDTSNDQTMFFTDCTDYFLAMQWNSQADADYQTHHLAQIWQTMYRARRHAPDPTGIAP
jgi:hypothetical protein